MNHAAQVSARNAQLKRIAGIGFHVIETATGKRVGDSKPLPYGFAKYVRDTRDLFNQGAFLVKRCS